MMNSKNIYLFFVFLIMTSCGVKQISTDNFAQMNDPSELNGRYINYNGDRYLSSVLFEMYNNESNRLIDVVDVYLSSNDSLIISYVDAAGDHKEVRFKGEFKDNYFEYYLQRNRLYAPPFLMRHWITKRRIGKNNEGKLEIHEYQNNWGALFIIYGGNSNTDSVTFEPYSKNPNIKLYSTKVNDKWGYKDQNDSIVIEPQYDYAKIFVDSLAIVALNNKWGCIDVANKKIIPIDYDMIIPYDNGLLCVKKDSKWGIIDLKNNIIAPLEYDNIEPFGINMTNDPLFLKLAKVYRNDKVGFINTKGEEIIPVEYDKIESGYKKGQPYYLTTLNGKYGYITGEGVFCDPIFDEIVEGFRDDAYFEYDKNILNKIGKYVKVTYQGANYVLGEDGFIYPYTSKISLFGLGNTSYDVDFNNGIKVSK